MVWRWLRMKRRNSKHKDKEMADTGVKQETPARKASKSPPCSSGKSASSSEPGSPSNKGSVSCLQAVSSETQSMTAELATTSKIPHREKAPLASRCNKEHPVQCHNKCRSKHVKDGGLNGSAHGEASKQRQSQGALKCKIKHPFGKTNTEDTTDSEHPSDAEAPVDFLGGAANVSHVPTFDKVSVEEEEEGDDKLLSSCQDREPPSESVSSQLRASTVSPEGSDGCSLSCPLEHTWQPHMPPTTNRLSWGFVICPHQHLPEPQNSRPTSQTRPASPPRSSLYRSCPLVVIMEDCATTDALQSSIEGTVGQLDNLDDVMTISDITEPLHEEECQGAEGGATADAQNIESPNDSNKEIVYRTIKRLLGESSDEDEEDQCRICHSGYSSPTNPLISPCLCLGSLHFIHLDCLKRWTRSRIRSGAGPYTIRKCELCMGWLDLDRDMLDIREYYLEQRLQMDDISGLLNLGEAARVLNISTVTDSSLNPTIQRAELLITQMRMIQGRIAERRSPSPDSSVA